MHRGVQESTAQHNTAQHSIAVTHHHSRHPLPPPGQVVFRRAPPQARQRAVYVAQVLQHKHALLEVGEEGERGAGGEVLQEMDLQREKERDRKREGEKERDVSYQICVIINQ